MNRSMCAWAVLCCAGSAVAQTGRYYLTDESGLNRVWQFQGGNQVASFPTAPAGPRHGPIIVDGNTNSIRTTFGGFTGGAGVQAGSEYDFAGNVLGPVSINPGAFAGYGRVIDAGFDGTNSYIVHGLGGAAGVVRYNADFSGPGTLMFNITGAATATAQGITYDTSTNTIWTSDYDFNATVTGGRVRQWSLTGVELFSFPVINPAGVASERNTALAYDQSDDTFWMNAHVENTLGFGSGELWQFRRDGTFIQAIHGRQTNPNAPTNVLYWGGEIRTIPAPSAATLMGLAGAALLRRRRR